MDQKRRVLIIPRNDGIAISMDEIKGVVIVKMDAEQMLNMAQRCQQAGLEMLRKEKAEQLLVNES
tara:strand:- start:1606 stop:1800 length:195 start_codon:yes stop_codon:yes gene_type:complete